MNEFVIAILSFAYYYQNTPNHFIVDTQEIRRKHKPNENYN